MFNMFSQVVKRKKLAHFKEIATAKNLNVKSVPEKHCNGKNRTLHYPGTVCPSLVLIGFWKREKESCI